MPTTRLASGLHPAPAVLLRTGAANSASLLNRAWRRGELTRVLPGVYTPTTDWRGLPTWDRYLARVHAVALRNPNAVFCGVSAAALRGVYLGRADENVHVLELRGSSRAAGAVRIHTGGAEREVEEVDGILLTSVPDTIVDVVRSVPPIEGLAYADALLRRTPHPNPEQLRAINECRESSRGRRNARWALARATGVPESVLESLSLGVIELAGFELPELQVTFRFEGFADRADFFWPSRQLIGEADGRVKYDDTPDAAADAIMQEKQRESRLRRQSSGLFRWGWTEIRQPRLLTGILSHAGVPRPHRNDTAVLATLRDLA
ncbi:hypothetical protein [Microbacterium capsulatum]|uniref:Transcriptional regulator, AbiEi antitoxin, Type IV TA system n=1 Tax=Microbacterium capsulatum TaxID=3041921 RepID=A0ABU0XFU5_9MICO|nr:hypothetical protein [Microbacterium sp. ASV81]MDQ4213992.1 hypothetical protein [Microbacterium sp. ASV81]